MAGTAIDVRAIVKRFGDFTAVKGISFTVGEGEIFGLLGPNGAGKSTLIRMLTTLIPPTEGTALVGGFDVISEQDKVRRVIGVIPQAMTSDTELSVEENLIIYAKLYGVPRDKRRRLIDELLAAVELTQWRDKQVRQLSGGMRRRVEIARGLVHEPRIFFLDEPTTGLDPVSRAAVWEMLRAIKATRDLTILITTHYMDEADKLCDRIAIVDHGELKALDSPLKLKAAIPGMNPAIRLHPLEPASSPTLSTGHQVGSHRIQGISDEFIPPIVDLGALDQVVEADDGDSILMAQKLACELGLAVGISSGANLIGASLDQEFLGLDAVVVTVFSDSNNCPMCVPADRPDADD